jgi:hypothetical protein
VTDNRGAAVRNVVCRSSKDSVRDAAANTVTDPAAADGVGAAEPTVEPQAQAVAPTATVSSAAATMLRRDSTP